MARFREGFRAFRVGRFLISPRWEAPAPSAERLVVDPGRAFGTGIHETTRLCLEALEDLASRRRLGRTLDLGAGTALLAVAAERLGAGPVFASDLAGEVVEVGASALPVVGTGAAAREFRVKVRLKQAEQGLRPGLSGDAEILVGEARDALAAPLQAVVLRGEAGRERPGVFAVDGGTARFVPLETGMIGGLEIELKSGIEAGREIVVGPWQSLRELQDGAAIRRPRKR